MAEGCRLLREGSPGDAWFLIQMELSLSLSLPVKLWVVAFSIGRSKLDL